MNLVPHAPAWLLIVLVLLLVAAAIEDAVRLRISNLTSGAVVLTALAAMLLAGPSAGLWQNALVFVLLLAVGTWMFAAGHIGGGDVKLLAALGLWVDLKGAVGLLATVFLAGGLLAIVYLARRMMAKGVRGARRGDTKDAGIPYGLAIVAGSSIVFAAQYGLFAPEPAKPNPLAIRPLS